jgi:hypothetical protein
MELTDHETFDLTDEEFDELMKIRNLDLKWGTTTPARRLEERK